MRGNVCWADSSRGTVEVASVDGRLRRLVADGLRHVTSVAVSASERRLFLALDGWAGSIQQLELDGSRRRPLVSEPTDCRSVDMHTWRLQLVELHAPGHQFAQSLEEAAAGRDVKPLLRLAVIGADWLAEVHLLRSQSRCSGLRCT